MYELKVVTRFAAAHRLTMVGTKCENMHGHNWKIEVFLTGEKLDEAGVVMDFGDIKTRLREIVGRLDHQYLNELPMFQGRQPSSERIATYVAAELQQAPMARQGPLGWLHCPPFDPIPVGGEPLMLGREASCALVLPHVCVSFEHAVVRAEGDTIVVEDRSIARPLLPRTQRTSPKIQRCSEGTRSGPGLVDG